jgi:hypothetical protein
MKKAYVGQRIDLLATGTGFQIKRAGEDPRFVGSPLRVPANVLRDRKDDVLSPAEAVLEKLRRSAPPRVLPTRP